MPLLSHVSPADLTTLANLQRNAELTLERARAAESAYQAEKWRIFACYGIPTGGQFDNATGTIVRPAEPTDAEIALAKMGLEPVSGAPGEASPAS